MATGETPKWKCRQGHAEHQVFLSYRGDSDAALAEALTLALRAQGITMFLDKYCLNHGENWEEGGFLHGLQTSRVVVLLLTEGALAGIRRAHDKPDSVLLEYQEALRHAATGRCTVLPVFVGAHALIGQQGEQPPEQAPLSLDVLQFTDEKPARVGAHTAADTADSPGHMARMAADSWDMLTVRGLMQRVCALQGIRADPSDLSAVVHRVQELTGTVVSMQRKAPQAVGDCTLPSVETLSLGLTILVAAIYRNGGYYTDRGIRLGDLPPTPPGGYMVDGDYYEGEFRGGKAHGRGRYIGVSGNFYEGSLRYGLQHGQGKCFFASGPCAGDRYEGAWRKGDMQGQGTYYNANGDRYEGEFREGNMHGQGKYFYANGDRYEGEFREGNMHGQGKYFYTNGDRYEGGWHANMQLIGTYYFADGGCHEGAWQDGQMHGLGKVSFASGNRYEGEFRNGKMHGLGKSCLANGNRYEGEFRDYKMHGQGKYFYAIGPRAGGRYEGEWRDGMEHGQGTLFFAGGGCYEGQWACGRRHGQGVERSADGSVKVAGTWQDGAFEEHRLLWFWCTSLCVCLPVFVLVCVVCAE